MTAAELLANALPPSDDGVIEKAIADLDAKLWEWTDALKSAQTQLRNAFALRPLPVSTPIQNVVSRPSSYLYEEQGPMPSLAASAAAAHVPSPPPPPDWMTTAAKVDNSWTTSPTPQAPAHGGHGAQASQSPQRASHAPSQAPQGPTAFQNLPSSSEWPQPPQQEPSAGVMAWPTAGSGAQPWPDATQASGATGVQQWPTWTPTDLSKPSAPSEPAKKSSVRATRAPKAVRPIHEGPTPEERAQKAAAEEALLSELDDAIARRVRLLRRLDPDTAIERLIEKAKQGQAEATASAPVKEDKPTTSSSSWWRRK